MVSVFAVGDDGKAAYPALMIRPVAASGGGRGGIALNAPRTLSCAKSFEMNGVRRMLHGRRLPSRRKIGLDVMAAGQKS